MVVPMLLDGLPRSERRASYAALNQPEMLLEAELRNWVTGLTLRPDSRIT